ncbi:hypothetical protein EOPP23_04650 [Endozoicomonas sp. OPT23]|uniref:hypothetical protein n=1 Tax=Endozoicomonas sp. OPT23 TaxID=2072845 RepID=UPI00129BE294|nr:hypothetical protein [Endozoicomonas sp. OPT23]MRI32283.1 hypothetical protein [Endozoicomonas sp. OPT23]
MLNPNNGFIKTITQQMNIALHGSGFMPGDTERRADRTAEVVFGALGKGVQIATDYIKSYFPGEKSQDSNLVTAEQKPLLKREVMTARVEIALPSLKASETQQKEEAPVLQKKEFTSRIPKPTTGSTYKLSTEKLKGTRLPLSASLKKKLEQPQGSGIESSVKNAPEATETRAQADKPKTAFLSSAEQKTHELTSEMTSAEVVNKYQKHGRTAVFEKDQQKKPYERKPSDRDFIAENIELQGKTQAKKSKSQKDIVEHKQPAPGPASTKDFISLNREAAKNAVIKEGKTAGKSTSLRPKTDEDYTAGEYIAYQYPKTLKPSTH